MADDPVFENVVRARRTLRSWSQDELARRSGISRAGISAIETDRLVPSAAAALAIAEALECRVEDLFHLRRTDSTQSQWAWPPVRDPSRFWQAEIGGAIKRYPAEATIQGLMPHDGTIHGGHLEHHPAFDPNYTLIMATCDPAAGLLAAELSRTAGIRLLALPRASRRALGLLGKGLVHVAGVHLARMKRGQSSGNAPAIRQELGAGYRLLRLARWEEGVAFSPGLRLAGIRDAMRPKLRWIGREEGSARGIASTRFLEIDPRHGASRPITAESPKPFAMAGPTSGFACAW